MIVYVLCEDFCGETNVLAVFRTLEAAAAEAKFLKSLPNKTYYHYWVDEHELVEED